MHFIITTLFTVIFFVGCGQKNGNELIEPNSDKENEVSSSKIPEKVPLLDVDSVLPSGELNEPESNDLVAKEEPKVDEEMSAKVKELSEKFEIICSSLCNKIDSIKERLTNIEVKDES